MSVTLCKRKLKSGNIQYYLAIYNSGEGKKFETLFTVKPTELKEKTKLAEAIRSQREIEILSKGTIYIPIHKKNLTLYSYVENYRTNYTKKDSRMISSVILKLKEFLPDKNFLIKNLSETHFLKFVDFLNNDVKLKGETPHSYWKRFKKIMLQANRDGYLDESVFKNVRFRKRGDYSDTKLTKQILTEEEIIKLYDIECGNSEVKRAFLFACYSGLGYAEMKIFNWSYVINNRLIINREKTGSEINISLSTKALELLGNKKPKDELIFDLKKNGKFLSETSVNKTLNNWIVKAEIDKHITFYCGRHTFAVRLLLNGANLKTVSEALAHKSVANTVKYLNYVNALKDEATSKL